MNHVTQEQAMWVPINIPLP